MAVPVPGPVPEIELEAEAEAEAEEVPGQRQKRSSLTEAAAYFLAAHLSGLLHSSSVQIYYVYAAYACVHAPVVRGSCSLARITHF